MRIKKHSIIWRRLLVGATFFFLLTQVIAQPCGPIARDADRIFLTAEGNILILSTLHSQSLFDVEVKDKQLGVSFTVIDPDGNVIKDAEVYMQWEGVYYDSENCRAHYNRQSNSGWSKYVAKKPCGQFLPFYQGDTTKVLFDLDGDHRNTYVLNFDKEWNAWAERLAVEPKDLRGLHRGDQFQKFSMISTFYLDDLYPDRVYATMPNYQVSSDSFSILMNDYGIEFQIGKDDRTQKFIEDEWWCIHKRRTTLVVGDVMYDGKPPNVQVKDDRLYIVSYLQEMMSCDIAPDRFPNVYAFNLKNGKRLWQRPLYAVPRERLPNYSIDENDQSDRRKAYKKLEKKRLKLRKARLKK